MKNTRKIIPALAMLIVAAVMLSSASYAWFTMSKEVKAQTMKVNVVAPQNLVISNTATGTFATIATADETEVKTLSPVSTITGANDSFFAIKDNQILTDGYKSTDTTTFAQVTDANKASYYADFDFWISTEYTNTSALDVKVLSTSLSGLGNTGFEAVASKNVGSMRFAVLKSDNSSTGVFDSSDAYQTTDKAIASLGTGDVKTLGDVTKLVTGTTSGTTVATIPENAIGSTSAQKVTIRVWVEGESNTNTAANIANVQNITLNVVFGI